MLPIYISNMGKPFCMVKKHGRSRKPFMHKDRTQSPSGDHDARQLKSWKAQRSRDLPDREAKSMHIVDVEWRSFRIKPVAVNRDQGAGP